MKQRGWKTQVAAIVSAMALAILANALWEAAVRPFFIWLANGVLSISTLGIKSLIDDVYVEIARSFNQRAALESLFALYAVLLAAFSYVFAMPPAIIFVRKMRLSGILESRENREQILQKILKIHLILMPFGLLALVLFMLLAARTSYIIRANNHLQQLVDVISADITDLELRKFRSRIAQIRSRDDFNQIENSMRAVALKYGLKTPQFTMF